MRHGSQIFREVDFIKGSQSNTDGSGECVSVARLADLVSIRDDKAEFGAPEDVQFLFTAGEFDHAQECIRQGVYVGLAFTVTYDEATRMYIMRSAVPQSELPEDASLRFTKGEIEVFYAAVRDREFDCDTVVAA